MPANDHNSTGALSLSLESLGINLPYSTIAEQAVLGAPLLDAEIVAKLVECLRPEMFYVRQNGEIFAEIMRLFTSGTPVDFITLLSAVQAADIFETEDAAKVYLTQLAETVPSLTHAENYVKIIVEKYRVRQLMNAAKNILEQTGEETDADLLLESAEQKIYEIRSGRDTSALTPINSVIMDTYAHLQEISGPNREKYLGIPTGFTYLDTLLTGLGRSDLLILAARPGMGKTSFALNIATNVAKRQDVPVAFFSLEMTKDQLVSRILSSEAAIDSSAFRTGELSTADWEDLAHASEVMARTHIFLDDTSVITIPEMKAKIRRINQDPARPNIGLVVIDYLQLMSSGKRTENRVQELSDITRNLKIMAKELNVPVIALSQLSRSAEKNRTDHRPMLSDLRDSGSIEQDADVVLFLYREAYYDNGEEADMTGAECIVAKNRHGGTGTVNLAWDGVHTRFTNVDYAHE
ncbi:MAG: replicative DNA helicase [Subdoligranulum sp.]|nr:replicative DNA helicase [Subdoligranulum sp.]